MQTGLHACSGVHLPAARVCASPQGMRPLPGAGISARRATRASLNKCVARSDPVFIYNVNILIFRNFCIPFNFKIFRDNMFDLGC